MLKKSLKIIGFIPAKENSSGFKNKNIKKLNNLTLVELAILSSINSRIIDQTYISSDSENILNIGKKYNINTIKRKKKYCSSSSSANDVIQDFINTIKENYPRKNLVIVYLQPTSPFRSHKHIDLALEKYLQYKPNILLSITKNKNFYKSFRIKKNKISNIFSSKNLTKNRQTFKEVYSPNGAIYIFSKNRFIKRNKLNFQNAGFFLMNQIESIDIDTKEDYEFAKVLSKKYIQYKK